MANCPLTGRAHPQVWVCREFPGRTVCVMCPAYGWRVRLAIALRFVRRLLTRIVIPLAIAFSLFGLRPMPALAAHNQNHQCAIIEQMIRAGTAGGMYYMVGARLTWSNGQTFAAFVNGICQTAFPLTNRSAKSAAEYAARDAAAHGASRVSASTARAYFGRMAGSLAGASGTGLLGAAPQIVVDPRCWVAGRNICLARRW